MDLGWNLSLFHYRNHGADIGRVLVGLQVRQKTKQTNRSSRPLPSLCCCALFAMRRRVCCSLPNPAAHIACVLGHCKS
jgi:hypothetical protein